MTIAVADWLLNGVPLQVTMPQWGKAYPNRGYGGMFRRIKGAQAIAAAIYLARQHQSKEEIRTYIEETFGYDLHRTCDDIRPRYQFDVSCQGSCPEAIIAFLDSSSYLSAIRLAVSLGGDSDTIACMTGGIAAAFYGIPTWIVKYVVTEYLPQDMREVIQRFDEVCAERNQE